MKGTHTMKRLVLTLCIVSMLTTLIFADPGDVLVGRDKAIWQVATYQENDGTPPDFPDGLMAYILTNMAAVPSNYAADADIQEWVGWVRIEFAQIFGVIFPKEVYNALVYAIDYYQYGTPQIAANRAAPACTAGAGQITCDDDPTGADRTPVLWRQVDGEFIEQDPNGVAPYTVELVDGTWTIATLPAIGNLIVAWDDEFQSFPTFKMTVTSP